MPPDGRYSAVMWVNGFGLSTTSNNLDDELKNIIMLHENGKNQLVQIWKSRCDRVDRCNLLRLEKQSEVHELAVAIMRVGNEIPESSCMPYNILAFDIRKNTSSGSRRASYLRCNQYEPVLDKVSYDANGTIIPSKIFLRPCTRDETCRASVYSWTMRVFKNRATFFR